HGGCFAATASEFARQAHARAHRDSDIFLLMVTRQSNCVKAFGVADGFRDCCARRTNSGTLAA
ncbi:MAG TPA: hypothetical protein VGI70_01000, partial [Polyangiales bacterium]